jgi:16S rRNA G966 N2-methylase RsmD
MCALIKANLDLCRVPEEQTKVAQQESVECLREAISRESKPWDIVFFDPPYANDYPGILELFGGNAEALLADQGLLIAEHHHKNQLPDIVESLRRSRILKQGDSALSFYQRNETW